MECAHWQPMLLVLERQMQGNTLSARGQQAKHDRGRSADILVIVQMKTWIQEEASDIPFSDNGWPVPFQTIAADFSGDNSKHVDSEISHFFE